MKYHFFWGGPFSNWYCSPFTFDGIQYNCVEQFMMAQKASLFGDKKSFDKIMSASDPKTQKSLGRSVVGFNQDVWSAASFPIVFAGCTSKFSQNNRLKDLLLETGSDILVEASPYDRIWGIGFNHTNALDNIDRWGENRLGRVLVEVRRLWK